MEQGLDLQHILDQEFLGLIIQLVVIFGGSILFASIAKHLKQPVVLGYIVGGIILGILLGPTTPFNALKDLLGGFSIDAKSGILYNFSQIGVVFLLFLAGIDTHFDELKANGRRSLITAVFGVVTPFLLVFLTFLLTGGNLKASIAMGVVVTATSISISIQTLKELGQLKSRPGIIVTGAAIIDDIIGLILITLLGLFMGKGQENASLLGVLGKIGFIFAIIAVAGFIVVGLDKKIKSRNWRSTHMTEIMMATITFCFVMAYFAQTLGVSAIIGSYFTGLILSMTRLKDTIEEQITPIAEIFFAPIFFISIGLSLNIAGLSSVLFLGFVIGLLAIGGKMFGAGFGAKLSGLNLHDSAKVGIAMVPMGEVAFIVASLAMGMGVLEQEHLAIAVMVIIMTSLASPILLKAVYAYQSHQHHEE